MQKFLNFSLLGKILKYFFNYFIMLKIRRRIRGGKKKAQGKNSIKALLLGNIMKRKFHTYLSSFSFLSSYRYCSPIIMLGLLNGVHMVFFKGFVLCDGGESISTCA